MESREAFADSMDLGGFERNSKDLKGVDTFPTESLTMDIEEWPDGEMDMAANGVLDESLSCIRGK